MMRHWESTLPHDQFMARVLAMTRIGHAGGRVSLDDVPSSAAPRNLVAARKAALRRGGLSEREIAAAFGTGLPQVGPDQSSKPSAAVRLR